MIKICHLTSVHPRYDGRIFNKECKSLQSAGYEVKLVVADGKGDEIVDNICIYDTGLVKGRINRIVRAAKNVQRKAKLLNCDLYHFHDPELIFAGLVLKRMGKKVIFDMHENVPADIEEKGYLHPIFRQILSYIYKKLEIYAVKRFDGVISTRESINNRLRRYNSNIEIITNFPIIEMHVERFTNSQPTLCFAGVIMSNWQHKEIIYAIDNIDNIKYILAGSADESYLNELTKLKGWSKVEYLGKVPFNRVKSIYHSSTIGLAIYIYCKNMDGNQGNFANTKLFEYMNHEIPIICTDFSLWKEIIVDELKCGICVNPYDKNAISSAIQYLINNPDVAIQMGKNGRNAVLTKYNWNTQEEKLIAFYQRIFTE